MGKNYTGRSDLQFRQLQYRTQLRDVAGMRAKLRNTELRKVLFDYELGCMLGVLDLMEMRIRLDYEMDRKAILTAREKANDNNDTGN